VEVVQEKERSEGGFSNLETRGSDEPKCWLCHPNSRGRMHAARDYVDCKEPDQRFAVDLNDSKRKPNVAMTGTLLVRLALARLPIGFIFQTATSVNLNHIFRQIRIHDSISARWHCYGGDGRSKQFQA